MKKHKYCFGWPEWTLVSIVVICAALITIYCVSGWQNNPVKRAESELKMLADEYYTTYLYPRLLGNSKTAEEAMRVYDGLGVPTIYLRQLLHFDNGRFASSAEIFDNLACNTNTTGIHYYPYAPYGPRDYRVDYIWRCDQND